jgi:hypothetical protein
MLAVSVWILAAGEGAVFVNGTSVVVQKIKARRCLEYVILVFIDF